MQRKRRFELLKDLPGIPKGTISEEYATITHEGRVEAFHITFIDCGDGNIITLDRRKCPDWVREIEELEFSRREMVEFAKTCSFERIVEHKSLDFDKYFDDLLKARKAKNISKTPHSYNLGDLVLHEADSAPFEVVGIRNDVLEIKGDWSGGTNKCNMPAWVPIDRVKPFPKKS